MHYTKSLDPAIFKVITGFWFSINIVPRTFCFHVWSAKTISTDHETKKPWVRGWFSISPPPFIYPRTFHSPADTRYGHRFSKILQVLENNSISFKNEIRANNINHGVCDKKKSPKFINAVRGCKKTLDLYCPWVHDHHIKNRTTLS